MNVYMHRHCLSLANLTDMADANVHTCIAWKMLLRLSNHAKVATCHYTLAIVVSDNHSSFSVRGGVRTAEGYCKSLVTFNNGVFIDSH